MLKLKSQVPDEHISKFHNLRTSCISYSAKHIGEHQTKKITFPFPARTNWSEILGAKTIK